MTKGRIALQDEEVHCLRLGEMTAYQCATRKRDLTGK